MIFLIRNIFEPNFFYIQAMIHKTFMLKTHSWQIQNRLKEIWIILLDQTIFGPKSFLVPNIFGPKFSLDLSYDSESIHVQNTFLTDSKQIKKKLKYCFWTKIFLT